MPTDAQAYFQALLEQHPVREVPPHVATAVMDELGIPKEKRNLHWRHRVPDLLKGLEGSLPPVAQQLLREGRLVVGEIGADTPNGCVTPLADDQFVIVLHSGLFAFLYRIARPLASAVFRSSEDPGAGIDIVQLARIVAEVFWWLQRTGGSLGPEYDVTFEQKHIANILATGAERFVLAHELGHVLMALEVSSGLDAIKPSEEEQFVDTAALFWILNACIRAGGKVGGMEIALAYAGAELALQIWNVMERIGLHFVDGVHPPASERIAELRRSLRGWCETDKTFEAIIVAAKVIERAFNEVGQIILKPDDRVVTYRREAESLVAELKDLLDRCSKGRIPDYSTFYEQAPALLARGYPELVLERVVVDVVDGFKEMVPEAPGEHDGAEVMKRFSQFKLLFGLTAHLPEPAKSLYERALERIRV